MKESRLNIFRKLFVFVIVLLALPGAAEAQTLAQHNWYFGSTAARNSIRFNRADNTPTLITNRALGYGTGGGAVATDPATANLLFYSDGANVYDASHIIMLNGGSVLGFSGGNQPAVVCAVPGQPNKYFVFTNSSNFTAGTVQYSVVDMTKGGNALFPRPALGEVDLTRKNIPIAALAAVSEGMMIIPHTNGTDFFLITMNAGTQTYNSTLISALSYNGSFSTSTQSGIGNNISVANFSYNAKVKKIIACPQNTNTDIHILSYDNSGPTQPFGFDSFILNSGTTTTANQSVYDAQWDSNGQYIYFSRVGEPGIPSDLFQYDYINTGLSLKSILQTPVAASYGLQVGPDSAMYFLYQATAGGDFLVDRFTRTDTLAGFVVQTKVPFGALTNFGARQFPSFLPKSNINLVVDFTFDAPPNCQNTPINFYPTVTPNADSLHWVFGDGRDTTQWSPIHTYQNPGAMNVTLTAFYQGQQAAVTKVVNVTAFPLKLTLVSDTTACACQLPARKAKFGPCTLPDFSVTVKVQGGTASSFLWSNGETSATLHPDSAGYYYVVVTGAGGCSTYAGVNVKEFKLQDRRLNIWYFGNKAGIDFNKPTPVALNVSAMNAPEGCAIACDRNGQAIFYTDGSTVWDKNNLVIATGIGGDPLSSQSALIIPVPEDETLFYIFTTQAINGTSNNELKYSLYDLKQNAVVISNQVLFSKSAEHITGNREWLIAHENGNNTFRAYPISSTGIGDPIYSSVGSDLSFQVFENAQGYMTLGQSNKIALAIATPGVSNIVELFDFTDSTGVVSNVKKIDLKTTAGNVYGVGFSGSGSKLYASVSGASSQLFEYMIDSIGAPYRKNVNTVPAELGAIQLGPDNQVYVAVNSAANNGFLGVIQPVEDTTQISNFQLNGFALAGGTNSRLGLPNFIQMISNSESGPDFTFSTPCVKDSVAFTGIPRNEIDQFFWDFGDGTGSSDPKVANPKHLYAAAGTYTVTLKIVNRCPDSEVILTKEVIVHDNPPKPTLPAASAICNGALTLDANANNLPNTTYQWSTGATTKTITVSKRIFQLSVTNTDEFGCTSTAKGAVGDARPVLDFGPDQTVCQSPVPLSLNATNAGATYAWTTPGGVTPSAASNPIQAVDVSASFVGPQTYSVIVSIVIDPATGTVCTATDDITFNVKQIPTFNFAGIAPTSCATPNGTTSITLTGPENVLYSYQVSGPSGIVLGEDQAVNGTPIINPAQAGSYFATVTNQISLCSTTKDVALSDLTVTVNAANVATCANVPVHVTLTGFTTYDYKVNASGGTPVSAKTGVTGAAFDTDPLPVGDYTIEVTGINGCVGSTQVSVTQTGPPVDFFATSDLCASPRTVTAVANSGAPTFTWTGSNITGGSPGATITINPPTGAATYTVTGSQAGFCDKVVTVPLTIPSTFIPSFTQADNCTDLVTLTAAPTGSNFTYNWLLQTGGVFTLVGSGQQIFVSDPGASVYKLNVTNGNGCPPLETTQTVNVFGDLTVGITQTPACDNGAPFTLTATSNQPSASFTWFLNDQAIAGATSATLENTTPGTFKVRAATADCEEFSSIRIILIPSPVGNLPTSALICDDPDNHDPATKFLRLDPGVFLSYNWFKDNVALDSIQQAIIISSPGKYAVDITNAAGCTSRDQTTVDVNCEPIVNAPTAFRPTSSVGDNKQFQVYSFFITDEFQVFIYNRWGELIYTSNDRYFKWNGTLTTSGEPTPGGAYAYIIKYVSSYRPEKGVQEKHGGVLLLR